MVSQLSLLFKDRILSVHSLKRSTTIIGSASDCQIKIDSLAVRPHHAKITYSDQAFFIEKSDDDAIILINNIKIQSSKRLSDSDYISIGKHTLSFSFDERHLSQQNKEPKLLSQSAIGSGWLQYLNGLKMGTTLQIKQNMLNISDDNENNIAMISSRSDGFYITSLKSTDSLRINNKNVNQQSHLLATDSKISLGPQEILFYITPKKT